MGSALPSSVTIIGKGTDEGMLQIRNIGSLPGRRNPVFSIESGLEAPVFFTAGNDPGVVKWDLRSMNHEKVLVRVNSSVYALHRSSSLLFIGERSGQVSVIDL